MRGGGWGVGGWGGGGGGGGGATFSHGGSWAAGCPGNSLQLARGKARECLVLSPSHNFAGLPPSTRRHWAELQSITGCKFNLAEDAFKLQHLLDANLLARRWRLGRQEGGRREPFLKVCGVEQHGCRTARAAGWRQHTHMRTSHFSCIHHLLPGRTWRTCATRR